MTIQHRRFTALIVLLATAALVGCDAGHDARLQAAQSDFEAMAKAQHADLQWRLDDATAAGLFDEAHYLTFRKCHDEPPLHDANKRTCETLRGRVAKQEATNSVRAGHDSAKW